MRDIESHTGGGGGVGGHIESKKEVDRDKKYERGFLFRICAS